MLQEIKEKGSLVAAHRPTENSIYIEGFIRSVRRDGEDYFYSVAWEDGAHFGEYFYEGELDEIDLLESEALLRVSLADFFPERAIEDWLNEPNSRLQNLAPLDALEVLGLRRVSDAAIEDYGDALQEDYNGEYYEDGDSEYEDSDDGDGDPEDELEGQLRELFSKGN